MSDKIWHPSNIEWDDFTGMVFTNGCFDIIHAGHVRFLQRAKEFGKHLVVALNSDASVRRLKGDSRPINKLEDRMQVVAALSCVDVVTHFDTNDVSMLLYKYKPHCWIKAGYTIDTLNKKEVFNARQVGTAIVLLENFGNYSTTSLQEKLKHTTNST